MKVLPPVRLGRQLAGIDRPPEILPDSLPPTTPMPRARFARGCPTGKTLAHPEPVVNQQLTIVIVVEYSESNKPRIGTSLQGSGFGVIRHGSYLCR
jgi:hypothetical protein